MRRLPSECALMLAALMLACTTGAPAPESHCTPPTMVTYSTEALAPGTPGCSGSPQLGAGESLAVPDPHATFSAGTTVTFPRCHPVYPNAPLQCTCAEGGSGDGGASFVWGCPL